MSKYVLKGKNDFLFLNNDSNRVVDQHTGTLRLGSAELKQWLSTYCERKSFCDEAGIDFYVQLSPDKHRVYEEYLPEDIKRASFTAGDQFSSIVRSVLGNNFLDATEVLLEGKKQDLLFHKTDTHWNARGAYLAYKQFISAVSQKYEIKEAAFKERLVNLPGDLGCKLTPVQKSQFVQSGLEKDKNLIFSNDILNTGGIKIYENKDQNLPVCMVYGSSSLFDYYLDYLAESFSVVVFIWDLAFDYDLIKTFKPDIILNQVRERFVVRPVHDEFNLSVIDKTIIKKYLLGDNNVDLTVLAEYMNMPSLKDGGAKLLTKVFEKVIGSNFVDDKYNNMIAVALQNNGLHKEAKKLCQAKKLSIKSAEKKMSSELEKAWTEKHIQTIKCSDLFDEIFYKSKYKDIARLGIDPARHYFTNGWKEFRNPSPEFCTKLYMKEYHDVANSGMNPLLHYIVFGKKEGRKIFPVKV